jgi:hypothetical protein
MVAMTLKVKFSKERKRVKKNGRKIINEEKEFGNVC